MYYHNLVSVNNSDIFYCQSLKIENVWRIINETVIYYKPHHLFRLTKTYNVIFEL
jgi:hypothetical protein